MIASIDNKTGLIIESQSNPRAGTLIENALQYGYTDVSEIEVTELELDDLLKAKELANETTHDIIARLQGELDAIERSALMPRGAREAFIVICEQQAQAAGLTKDQAYQANPFYRGLKDTDAICVALRQQIRDLS